MSEAESDATVVVLDASVAVRWVVPEHGSDQAADLLSRPLSWIAPRLMLTEAASAVRRKVAGGELRAELAVDAVNALVGAVADGTIRLIDDEEFVPSALTLALALGHRLPDCLYLAVAERQGSALATADVRLGALARERGIQTYAVPSA